MLSIWSKTYYVEDFSIFTIFWAISVNEKLTKFRAENDRLAHGLQYIVVYHVKENYFMFQNLFLKPWATQKKIFEAAKYK